jgi:DNA-nicking Smr family endonuclease
MRRRTQRRLSEGELQLWTQVARSTLPLPGRNLPELDDIELSQSKPASAPGSFAALLDNTVAVLPVRPAPKPAVKPALKPLAPIERRVLTALKRGAQSIGAVIDLHGLRQDEAHGALRHFIVRAQGNGITLVLVVTGKGGIDAGPLGEARGVLRRVVPHWLRMADMRSYVLGFDEAARNHGGAGALYVRIRRHRELAS